MDDTVLAALAKWPDVPAVYGWLGLSVRGEWRLRGQPIGNAALRDFIGRNYGSDERGRWFFQNGPQCVFVELEVAPWVWRLAQEGGDSSLYAHTAVRAQQLEGAWLDEGGRVFLKTDLGFGLLDSRDSSAFLDVLTLERAAALQPGDLDAWLTGNGPCIVIDGARLGLGGSARLDYLRAEDAPGRFGFERSPRSD